jgi:hypothetical protein
MRYLVYRNPSDCLDDQAIAIIRLARRAPLAMVVEVTASSKCLEAWFVVSHFDGDQLASMRKAAIRLGAWERIRYNCQPYTLPGMGHGWHLPACAIYLDLDALIDKPSMQDLAKL